MYIIVYFCDMLWRCRGATCGKTFRGIPRNLPRTCTAYPLTLTLTLTLTLGAVDIGGPWGLPWHDVGLPSGAVAVAAGIAMVPPMVCHGPPRRAMQSYATPWDAMVCHGWYHGDATVCHEKFKRCRALDVQQLPPLRRNTGRPTCACSRTTVLISTKAGAASDLCATVCGGSASS